MTSPFDKLAKPIGQRGRGPQFPQRRALIRKKKGGRIKHKIPGYFFGGMFEGKPASSSSYQTSSTNTNITDPNYNALRETVLGNANSMLGSTLSNPIAPYSGVGVVGQNPDQLNAAQSVRNNQAIWQPYLLGANNDIQRSRGFDPFNAGNSYIQQAGGMSTGTEAASPFINQASKTFPGAVQEYMSPYTENVVNRIADLGARNLNEKLLPGIHDTFTGGNAAQFGRERHADIAGRALRDTQESILGQQSEALERGYTTAGTLFNADQNRQAQLAQTSGGLANTDINTRAALGATAGSLAGASGNLALNQATAQQGLGQATQTAAGKDAAALQAVGDSAQQNAQAKETFDYQQFMARNPFQNPWQALQAGQSLGQGWQLPTSTNSTSYGTQTQQAAQGSPFGQILGGALSLGSLAIPGAGGVSALGNIFGGGAAAGSGTIMRDGGYIERAVGGMVPTISQIRKRTMRQPSMQPGMQPTGMPGMPPMAPPNPQVQQPNGQMPQSPFARGGHVRRRRVQDDDYKARLGRRLSMRFADGGYADSPFLRSSEGLEDRLARPRPFDPTRDRYSDMSIPTGREARYRGWGPGDIAARMLDSLPQGVRNNIEFVRDQMPDRMIGYALDELRGLGQSAMEGSPFDSAEHAGMAIINGAGVMIPGLRGVSALTPLARSVASRMVR